MQMKSSAFEQIYSDYLKQISKLDLPARASKLGAQVQDSGLIIPFYGRLYTVCADGVFDEKANKPIHAETVVLCKYVLLCPYSVEQDPEWVSFKDFPDAAPFTGAFVNNVEKPIAQNFQGRLEALENACIQLGGINSDLELSYELKMQFKTLPKVDVLLLFNDADEEFPAESRVLFTKSSAQYLDMECLAIVGWLLSDYLNLLTGGTKFTIM